MLAQQTKGIDKDAPMIVIGTSVPKEFWKVLSIAQLHDNAELVLRRNGVPLFQKAAQGAGRPVGWLLLTISGLKSSEIHPNVFSIRAEFTESVVVARHARLCALLKEESSRGGCLKTLETSGVVWSEDALVLLGDDVLDDLRSQMKDLTEKFAIYYLRNFQR